MPTETIYVGKDEVKVPTAPITLIFNRAPSDTFYPDRLMIDPEMTRAHFEKMTEINPFVAAFFKLVVRDYPHDVTLANVKQAVPGFKHLVALFDLSLQFLLEGRKFGWKYPETYLHPCYQVELAEALIVFSDREKFIKFIQEVKQSL